MASVKEAPAKYEKNNKNKKPFKSFEQTFKNIDDALFKDAGADSELDYIGQTSWVLFLRYLDQLEQVKADEQALEGKDYEYILAEEYRWPNWAMPKNEEGNLDHHVALTGKDLIQFVDTKLFPYLSEFKQKADNAQTIEYKIGEIFSELKNKIQSGYILRDIIDHVDDLPFGTSKDKHELSHLYETKIKNMGNAGRNGGQYYTPRPLIRAMIQVLDPQIGETVYDGAAGSAGFLCETFEYMYGRMHAEDNATTDNLKTLQENTFTGKEKKNLAYVIGIMNMILHGIEAPNLIHTNTLGESIRDIQEKDRFDIILANPPFGGKERKEVQQNFDIKTGETAFLFLQHFIKSLKAGGRAAIVIKNTFLSNTDNAAISLRKHLLETCNLHTVLDMPSGTFLGAGVKTVVLFFQKGEPTKNTWYYQLDPGRNMGKTNPLNDKDMAVFIEQQKNRPESEQSWVVSLSDLEEASADLSVNNPNIPEEVPLRDPEEILEEMSRLDNKTEGIPVLKIQNIKPFSITLKKMDYVEDSKYKELIRHSYKNGDIIMTKLGDPLGASAIVEDLEEGLIVADLVRIRANLINTNYLCYHLNSPVTQDNINSQQKGATRPRVKISSVRELPIYAPQPEEQKQIVAILDKAFDAIDQAQAIIQQNIQNAQDLFQSKLNQIFSQRGEGWEEKLLIDIAEVIDSLHKTPKYKDEGFPMVRVTDIKSEYLDLSDTKKVDEDTYTEFSKKHKSKKGDIVFSRVGSYGRSSIVNTNEPFCLGQNTVFLIPEINTHYFYYFLNSPNAKDQIDKVVSGSTQPTVSLKSIRAIRVPISTDSIQKEIVQELISFSDKTQKLEGIYNKKLLEMEELKKSLLQKAFNGELTESKRAA